MYCERCKTRQQVANSAIPLNHYPEKTPEFAVSMYGEQSKTGKWHSHLTVHVSRWRKFSCGVRGLVARDY